MRKNNYKHLIDQSKIGFFYLFWVGLIFISCSQTKGGGSGGLDPTISPYLIEGLLCSDISPEQMPVGIADNFPVESRIYLWLHWANIQGSHKLEIFWHDPDGDEVHRQIFEFTTKENRYITWFYLNTTSSAEPGEWSVSIFLDDEFIRSYIFLLFQ